MGTEGGTIVFFGFITALKSASRSVSESPRTWTIWCPAGGLCWLGSIVPQKSANLYVSEKKVAFKKKKKKKLTKKSLEPIPNFFFVPPFFFFTQQESRKSRRQSVKVVPSHSTVEQPRTEFSFQSVLAVDTCSETQRFPVVSCWHTCEYNNAHIYTTLESMLSSGPNFSKKKKKKEKRETRPRNTKK